MKKIKNTVILLVILSVLTMLGSCTQLDDSLDNKDMRADTEEMLDSILANDLDGAYALMSDVCSKQQFASVFTQIRELVGNESEYKLSLLRIYYNTNVNDGQKVDSVSATYKITCGGKDYVIDVKADSLHKDLAAFYITPYENSEYYQTGTLGSMKGANTVQWILLLSNLISIALCIWALIDCSHRRIKKKWLIITMIILGFMSLSVSIAAGYLNFNWSFISYAKYTALILYGNGALNLRFMIPLGAIIYFIIRKRITKTDGEITQNGEAVQEEQSKEEPKAGANETSYTPSDTAL